MTIKSKSIEIKHMLSQCNKHNIFVPIGFDGINYSLDRNSLNEMVKPYMDMIIEKILEIID